MKVAIEPREVMELPAVGGGFIRVCRSCGQVSLNAQAIDHAETCVAIRSPIRSQDPPAVPVAPSSVQSTGATGPTEPIGVSDPAPVQRPTRVKCESCGGTGQHLRKVGAGECMFCGGFGQLPPGFTYCAACTVVISLGTAAFHPCSVCESPVGRKAKPEPVYRAVPPIPTDPEGEAGAALTILRDAIGQSDKYSLLKCASVAALQLRNYQTFNSKTLQLQQELIVERDALLVVIRLLSSARTPEVDE